MRLLAIVVPVLALAAAVGWFALRAPGEDALVVYCAHDAVYSEAVLRDFERETGIRVVPVFDSEATKSLGLIERLVREADDPRCDVFWNNELLGTLDLAGRGLLEPYRGPGWERIPPAFRDAEGRWAGFGARLRVHIVNTELCEPTPEAVAAELAKEDLSRVAIAKPLYGTTLTHYSVLWRRLGEDGLKAWHRDLRARGIREVNGNGATKQLVADGVCAVGYTDTDDFFLARDAGAPVAALPVRLDDGSTIAIPNTVAIVAGARHREQARRFVDWLLSAERERRLAGSAARQVPLGPVDEAALDEDVRELARWAADGVPLGDLGPARDACLAWLKTEYLE